MKLLFIFLQLTCIFLVVAEKQRRIILDNLLESKNIAQCNNLCDQAYSQFNYLCQMELKSYVKLEKFCEHQAQLQEQICHEICEETNQTFRNELFIEKYPRNNCTYLVEECKVDCLKKVFESEISCQNICKTFKYNCDIVYGEYLNKPKIWQLHFQEEKRAKSTLEQRRQAQKESLAIELEQLELNKLKPQNDEIKTEL